MRVLFAALVIAQSAIASDGRDFFEGTMGSAEHFRGSSTHLEMREIGLAADAVKNSTNPLATAMLAKIEAYGIAAASDREKLNAHVNEENFQVNISASSTLYGADGAMLPLQTIYEMNPAYIGAFNNYKNSTAILTTSANMIATYDAEKATNPEMNWGHVGFPLVSGTKKLLDLYGPRLATVGRGNPYGHAYVAENYALFCGNDSFVTPEELNMRYLAPVKDSDVLAGSTAQWMLSPVRRDGAVIQLHAGYVFGGRHTKAEIAANPYGADCSSIINELVGSSGGLFTTHDFSKFNPANPKTSMFQPLEDALEIGDVIVWNKGGAGHMAIFAGQSSASKVNVMELRRDDNFDGPCGIGFSSSLLHRDGWTTSLFKMKPEAIETFGEKR